MIPSGLLLAESEGETTALSNAMACLECRSSGKAASSPSTFGQLSQIGLTSTKEAGMEVLLRLSMLRRPE